MYTPKVSETNSVDKSKLMPVPFRQLSLCIIKGGCSGKAGTKARFDKLVDETNMFAKIFSQNKMNVSAFKCEPVAPAIKAKDRKILAAERTIPMPRATWKEYVCFVSNGAGDSVWEVRYAGSEPIFSKNKPDVLKTLEGIELP